MKWVDCRALPADICATSPTPTEPQSFSFDVVDRFTPEFRAISVRKFEITRHGVYQSLDDATPYAESDPTPRDALLCAKFERSGAS